MNEHQKSLVALANRFWGTLAIDSVTQLQDWQDRSYIPEKQIIAMTAKLKARSLSSHDEGKLAILYLSTSTQLIFDILARGVSGGLKTMHEQLEQDSLGVAELERIQKTMQSIFFLPQALATALNPMGVPELSRDADEIARLATRELMDKSIAFPPQDYKRYPTFALEVLTPYLPTEYVKLLELEFTKQKASPKVSVDASVIDPTTVDILDKIAKSGRSPRE